MNIDDAIREFATAGHTLPRAAMQWAVDNWAEAAPRFVEILDHYARAPEEERSGDERDALLFIIYLLAEKAETTAFRPLCRLMLDAGALDEIIGDGITEDLPSLLISLYDGDLALLKSVIENDAADEFIREAALDASTYLTFSGAIPGEHTRAYLRHLHETMQPRGENYVWAGLVDAIAALGFEDMRPIVVDLMEQAFVPPALMVMDDFDADLEGTLANPEHPPCFARDHIGPFGSAIEELSGWYGFSEEYRKDIARRKARETTEERRVTTSPASHVNPFKGVGRNDPCPCGSGRKFKKCCLP